ncbi:MAG: EAL domain-containing protein [Thermodesulfobacteriota bacterium]
MSIILLITFVVAGLALLTQLNNIKDDNYEKHLGLITSRYAHAYNNIYDQYQQQATTIQSGIMTRYQVLDIYQRLPNADAGQKDQLRHDLYERLSPRFAELQRSLGVRQLHFHLPSNESFLRLHRPSLYGDDLSNYRATVAKVNTLRQPIDGFEEGKVYSGFRFVFPINHGTEHLGSMEVSFSPAAVTTAMMQQYAVLSNFFVKEEASLRKLFPGEMKRAYHPSNFHGFLHDRDAMTALSQQADQRETPQLKPAQATIDAIVANLLTTGEPQSVYDSTIDLVFTSIPIHNSVSGEMVAFLTVQSSSDFFKREQQTFVTIFGLALFSLVMFLLTFFVQCSRNTSLQADNIKQLQLAANVLDNIVEGVVVTDTKANIVSINKSVPAITGFSEAELLGENPRLWRSEHHDDAFYQTMWQDLLAKGYWRNEIWNRNKDGKVYPAQMTITALKDGAGRVVNYVSVFSDISAAKESQEQMEFLAQYDQLTKLPNRALMNDRISQAIKGARRNGLSFALMLLDLDNFKAINDTQGHKNGDILLIQVAERLLAAVRQSDTVARLGGDEFVALLPDCDGPAQATQVAEKIIKTLATPFDLEGQEAHISASVGITIYPNDGDCADTLLKSADTAMYHVKHQSKNNFQFYAASMQQEIVQRLELICQMRKSVEREDFFLCYQPKLNLASGRVNGMEALVQWRHPSKGLISPGDFIHLAEETGIILPLGEWVLREACRQTKVWLDEGLGPLRLSVNLSARQFQDEELVEMVKEVLADTGFDPGHLELEITESTIMSDVEQTIKTLWQLRDLGILLSIDDFGTGYSSLNYLKRFPLDILKIDRSFVMDITSDPHDRAVVEAIVSLSRHLHLKVVAEGVESREQLEFLEKERCHEVQGYYIAKPLATEEFKSFLANERSGKRPPSVGQGEEGSCTVWQG